MSFEVRVYALREPREGEGYDTIDTLVSVSTVEGAAAVNDVLDRLWRETPLPEEVHGDSVQWVFGTVDADGVHLTLSSVSSGGIEETMLAVSFRDLGN